VASRLKAALGSVGIYLRSLFVFGCVWYVAARWIDNAQLLPQPQLMLAQWLQLTLSGEIPSQILVSVRRLVTGYAVAAVLAVPLGLGMALWSPLDDILDPLVELTRPIAGTAWIPLGLLVFGIGDGLTTFIVFHAVFFPLVLNTVGGVRALDRHVLDAARTLGVDRTALVLQVILPGALPSILTGARIALGAAWTAIVAAELLGSGSGIGFAIEWYRELMIPSRMLAVVATVAVLGYLSDRLLRLLERRLLIWQPTRLA
jgi:ABC-type nitrate/sulfonate/bicarbonate transport system permease component